MEPTSKERKPKPLPLLSWMRFRSLSFKLQTQHFPICSLYTTALLLCTNILFSIHNFLLPSRGFLMLLVCWTHRRLGFWRISPPHTPSPLHWMGKIIIQQWMATFHYSFTRETQQDPRPGLNDTFLCHSHKSKTTFYQRLFKLRIFGKFNLLLTLCSIHWLAFLILCVCT